MTITSSFANNQWYEPTGQAPAISPQGAGDVPTEIQSGQMPRLTEQWRNHHKYGERFQIFRYREANPATLAGLEKYAGSGVTVLLRSFTVLPILR